DIIDFYSAGVRLHICSSTLFVRPSYPRVADTSRRFWVRALSRRTRLLSALALQSERPGQVGARFGIVELDAQGLLEVFDRLGRLALTIEHHDPVVVSFGILGPDAQGLLEVF